jgi:hypothetical protein
MRFLDRTDLWDTVKPYMFQYYPNEDTKRHNLNHSPCTVRVQNMRSRAVPPSLDTEGCAVHRLPSTMSPTDFSDVTKVQAVYCRELEKYFLHALGAKHVRVLDYQVRPSTRLSAAGPTDQL